MIEQHRQPGTQRIENGGRDEVLDVSELGEVVIQFDVTGQWRTFAAEDLARLRLGYPGHIHRAQGATVTRTLVVTGGWQTSKEPAYVEASRARHGTDWYVSREELGAAGFTSASKSNGVDRPDLGGSVRMTDGSSARHVEGAKANAVVASHRSIRWPYSRTLRKSSPLLLPGSGEEVRAKRDPRRFGAIPYALTVLERQTTRRDA